MEWAAILNTIGAKKSKWRLLKAELQGISTKLRQGDLVTKEELVKLSRVWQSKEPFVDESGKFFVLFIYDRNYRHRRGDETSGYKFHFKWCKALEQMDRWGRRGRYKAKYDIDNPFFDSTESRKEKLKVCIYCLKGFAFKPAPTPIVEKFNIKEFVEEFNIKEFFDTYGRQDLRAPTHQHYTHKYTKDWMSISREYKGKQNWVCEGCNWNLSFEKRLLHTHHKNGVKDDNSRNNLKALCHVCHSKEPMHSNMG